MKEKVTITVDTELLDWIDKAMKQYKFGSRSHAFEFGIYKLVLEDNGDV